MAKVLSCGGKSSGKYKNAYNLEYISPNEMNGTQSWINLDNISNLSVTTNNQMESYSPASKNSTKSCNTTQVKTEEIYVTEEVSFDRAEQVELTSWKNNNVYKEVQKPSSNQKSISLRWVCTLKETKDDTKPKSRLVAQGFEEDNLSEIQKDSPTCSKDTLEAVLSIICQRKWNLQSIDIKTAFCKGIH